jgi:fluoride exporter
MRDMDSRLLWVCIGGAAGTAARYWIIGRFGIASGIPYGTLLVNGLGSFLIGALVPVGASTDLLSPTARIALGVGVLGGFTTYSAFCFETLGLLQRGSTWTGFLYVAVTVLGCLAACALGYEIARWCTSPQA